MRILVTGACGYIGSMLVERALAEGHTVFGIDNLTSGHPSIFDLAGNRALRFVRGDVRHRPSVVEAVASSAPDAIVHLAAVVGAPACRRDPEKSAAINVGGTSNVVAAVREACPDAHVIFASTDSVYGRVDGPCTEDSPTHPLTEYGRDKEAAERIVRGGASRFTILRFATAFGLSRRPRLDLLVNDFVWQAVRNRYLVVYEGEFRRSFLDVADIVRAVLTVAGQPDMTVGQTYNVGDDRLNATKADIANLVGAAVPGTRVNLLGDGRDPDQRDYVPDHAKIRSIGFDATVTLEDGIRRLARGYQMMDDRSPWRNDAGTPV